MLYIKNFLGITNQNLLISVHKDKIFEVRWDSNNVDKLITVGIRHIKFWTQAGGGLTSKRGIYGKLAKADSHLCVTCPKSPGVIVSGSLSGLVYIWNEEVLKSTVQAHQGPVFAIHALEKVLLKLLMIFKMFSSLFNLLRSDYNCYLMKK